MLASNFAVNDEFLKYMPNTFNSNFEFDDVTPREIKNVVDSLKNSSPGIDNIPMLIFKNNIDSLADIMSYICVGLYKNKKYYFYITFNVIYISLLDYIIWPFS